MANNQPNRTPFLTVRKLIQLVIETLGNANETKSLALINARSELDFELSLASIELVNCQSQHYERLWENIDVLLRILYTLVIENNDDHPKPTNFYQRIDLALARASDYEADPTKPSLIQLPQTVEEFRNIAQKVSAWRQDNKVVKSDLELGKDDAKKEAAEEFMEQAYEFYDAIIKPQKGKMAIKVAVLDTGVDKDAFDFGAERERGDTSLKAVESFIEEVDARDTYGHGTDVASLIVQMAPHVDLFIAKISEGKCTSDVSAYVKAIKWAMEHKVHIINISSSIDEDEGIEDIISKAESQGIIVFAAASDNQANKPRPFPANMDKVLAVYFTDGRGNICDRNPRPVDEDANISTLGECIPSLTGGIKPLSGTSYATAIASGMAVNILTLADEHLKSKKDQWLRRRVFRRDGMRKIFIHISRKKDLQGYNYVCPIRVKEVGDRGNDYRGWFIDALQKS
ncbi:hypothetical protein NXS19_009555 [Fusarium pseudograminearum]|uniref:Peptidase S8/S53 domain-containing protein n=1 Tax=Fusarium pseudograminearum (strain CS3096) TaxID=1028729 RepID=K3VRG5_FUSPC|nr:hypothetical protein FPSE_03244 [Fusarium pseudograminearum CS3096]EKJ76578.1 hypothetical protein FPSE_03244 [Fusarium pseudograminearum CS3096]UZP41739.1 hypothetical protein NXS19_009555 [Fusarium pseudograminearum]